MERTIRRDGFLFCYAYWFTSESKRPKTVNLCPFFWRVVFTTILKMPLWWLVWAPIGFVIGFFFAARPRIFAEDGCSKGNSDDLFDCVVHYEHWPRVDGARIWPIVPIAITFAISFVTWILYQAYHLTIWSHSLLFWIGGGIAGILALLVGLGVILSVKEKIAEQEWYKLTQDKVKSRKEGICPTYKVV